MLIWVGSSRLSTGNTRPVPKSQKIIVRTNTNLPKFALAVPGLLLETLSRSSCKLCLKLQSGPLSHLPLFKKSKHTPLIDCSLASSSCRKWHFSPREQEPDEMNLKHSLSPSLAPTFCRLETSYRQYCESDSLSGGLFTAPSELVAFSINVYGDKVVFVDFMDISAEDIVDAGVGEIAWINFWEAWAGTKCYRMWWKQMQQKFRSEDN